MRSICEECGYCRWETEGNGWDEPRVSFPSYCAAGHKDIFDSIYDENKCPEFSDEEPEDEGPDPMDAYKQKLEDDMLDKIEGRW